MALRVGHCWWGTVGNSLAPTPGPRLLSWPVLIPFVVSAGVYRRLQGGVVVTTVSAPRVMLVMPVVPVVLASSWRRLVADPAAHHLRALKDNASRNEAPHQPPGWV